LSKNVDEDETFSDEIKPEDGRLRYWVFFNGEQYRLFSAIITLIFGVLWGFLYVLGAGESKVAIGAFICGAISFVVFGCFTIRLKSMRGGAGERTGLLAKSRRSKSGLPSDCGYLS
jgi:hypothetical protein